MKRPADLSGPSLLVHLLGDLSYLCERTTHCDVHPLITDYGLIGEEDGGPADAYRDFLIEHAQRLSQFTDSSMSKASSTLTRRSSLLLIAKVPVRCSGTASFYSGLHTRILSWNVQVTSLLCHCWPNAQKRA